MVAFLRSVNYILTKKDSLKGYKIMIAALTFDDACASHRRLVAPLLHKLGFGATFFVCEFPDFRKDKEAYMSWEEIRELHEMGFEVGNHNLGHEALSGKNDADDIANIEALNAKFAAYGLPRPSSYAYPGGTVPENVSVLSNCGIRYARTIVKKPWEASDDLLHIPAYPVHGEDDTAFLNALSSGGSGKIPVLVYHGVPDLRHPWVNMPETVFVRQMEYLKEHDFTILSLADAAASLQKQL